MRVKTDFFFVPNRLVWDNWQKFITGGEDGLDASVPPYVQIDEGGKSNFGKGTLADFIGVPDPTGFGAMGGAIGLSAIPFRAYQLIFNEYYRDQNLVPEATIFKTDGHILSGSPEYNSILTMRKRAWEKDYFTSALPFAQKGGAVIMPMEADVNYKPISDVYSADGIPANVVGSITTDLGQLKVPTSGAPTQGRIENIESVENGSTTINDLRTAVRLQEWLERNARAGSRYIENILANWGVLSSDARLQRPEYLGGGSNAVVISEVLSTFQAGDDSGYPQGNMTGHGISAGNISGFKRRFEEHGYVIGLMTVLPRTAYQQGLPKHLSRFDKFDYAWPSFAQLGEQEIKNQEIYMDPVTLSTNQETFGYQSRYADYKYQPSTVHGDMKDTLSFWHMGRQFSSLPVLNQSFIQADPTKRIFAVETLTEDEIIMQLYNRVDVLRALPYFNTPTL